MIRALLWLALALSGSCAAALAADSPAVAKPIGGGCDGCELIFAGLPQTLHWQTTIGDDASGEPLEIAGHIYQADGKTPAADVTLYFYHTDAQGFYSPAHDQKAGARHGRLRGWIKTGADGRYKFRTIRPGAYPGRDVPAHIHPIIMERGKNEYYIDDYLFDDDPLLTREKRAAQEDRGGRGVVRLVKNTEGVWSGQRDIILGRKIPDYR